MSFIILEKKLITLCLKVVSSANKSSEIRRPTAIVQYNHSKMLNYGPK